MMFEKIGRKMRQTEVGDGVIMTLALIIIGFLMYLSRVVGQMYTTGDLTIDKKIVLLLVVVSGCIILCKCAVEVKDRYPKIGFGRALNWT